jgi:ABC-type multidrug transport system ATPase subunit
MSILTWKDVSFRLKTKQGSRKLLSNISGQVKEGQLVAILGPTGSG